MQIPYARWIAVSASPDLLAQPTDAIYVGAAGTITFTTQDGTSCAVPVPAGGYLLAKAYSITSVGAATSVFALYR